MNIRTELNRVSKKELASFNKERGDNPFLPADEELEIILRTNPERTIDRDWNRWSEHPDELVQIAFLRTVGAQIQSQGRRSLGQPSQDMASVIAKRIVTESDSAKEAWNPSLDLLVEAFGGEWTVKNLVDFEKRIDPIQKWAKKQKDPEALRVLAHFDSGAMRYVQYSFAKVMPRDTIPFWVRSTSDAYRIFENEDLRDRYGADIVEHIFNTFGHREARGMEPHLEGLPESVFAKTDADYTARITEAAFEGQHFMSLSIIISKVPHMHEETAYKLLDNEYGFPGLIYATAVHPEVPQEIRQWALDGKFNLRGLAEHPRADVELLWAAWESEGLGVAEILAHRTDVPADLALEVAVVSGNKLEEEGLPPIAKIPEVAYSILERQGSEDDRDQVAWSMLTKLVEHWGEHKGQDVAINAVFERGLKNLSPESGYDIVKLLDNDAVISVPVAPNYLEGLLKDREREVRQKALLIAGKFQAPSKEEEQKRAKWVKNLNAKTEEIKEKYKSRLKKSGQARKNRGRKKVKRV